MDYGASNNADVQNMLRDTPSFLGVPIADLADLRPGRGCALTRSIRAYRTDLCTHVVPRFTSLHVRDSQHTRKLSARLSRTGCDPGHDKLR